MSWPKELNACNSSILSSAILLTDIHSRLGAIRIRRRPDSWLFPNLPTLDELVDQAPNRSVGVERREWARERLAREVEIRHARLREQLGPGAVLSAHLRRGELRFLIDGIPVVAGIFLPPKVAPFVLAQWRVLAGRLEVTGKLTGKKLADELKRVSVNADSHLMAEVVQREDEISAIDAEIARAGGPCKRDDLSSPRSHTRGNCDNRGGIAMIAGSRYNRTRRFRLRDKR